MAREQASVPPPAQARTEHFSPHPVLRSPARDGAALSLRLFGETEDDATALVLGDATSKSFTPIPARAGAFFEAHAAALAGEMESSITVGFPLATFVQQGTARAAPLLSRGGGRARWKLGDADWKVPPGARPGATLTIPDALLLQLGGDEPYTVHAGVWHHLFGLDSEALATIAAAGAAGIGALVRIATRVLDAGGEGAETEAEEDARPLTREDLAALGEAAMRRAPASRALKCHPHALAMMPPRGDPTSGLRLDLHAVVAERLSLRGPLAVYLGAPAARPRDEPLLTSGSVAPTPSQEKAARAFEGSEDLVVVCGPPGCGKTALLHHVAAQTVVSCALGSMWTATPPLRAAAWPLVVTSTNNAAVDHALAPFVARGSSLPVGLRLGNRRSLAETTANALSAAIDWLGSPEEVPSLADARATFDARASTLRAYLRERAATEKQRSAEADHRRALEYRVKALHEELSGATLDVPAIDLAVLDAAEEALREHATAAERLTTIHLEKKPSITRAVNKWARANELRAPRIEPALAALGLAVPYGDLDRADPPASIARQREAIAGVLASLAATRKALAIPQRRRELEEASAKLGAPAPTELSAPPLDPGLYDAALAVRAAWARTHREVLLPRLAAARDAARAEWTEARGKPLQGVLRELASLFPVAGCTLLSMRASFPFGEGVIDRLVIDEAAQCAPIYAVPALARSKRAMLTGDLAQLPPVYTLDPRVDDRCARDLDVAAVTPFRMSATSISSAQAVADTRARSRLALTEHFRSQPDIVALASRWSGYTLDVRTPARSLTDLPSVIVRAVRGTGGRAAEGVVNAEEAEAALELVSDLVLRGVAPADIAVLTPFVGQGIRIERALAQRNLAGRDGVLVSTVHRLQGGERRIVVFSVTATERHHLRWLGDRPHLLHVATSRAQDHLIVLVDPDSAARTPSLAPFAERLQ